MDLKVGDRVRLVKDQGAELTVGAFGTVSQVNRRLMGSLYPIAVDWGGGWNDFPMNFEEIELVEDSTEDCNCLSVDDVLEEVDSTGFAILNTEYVRVIAIDGDQAWVRRGDGHSVLTRIDMLEAA